MQKATALIAGGLFALIILCVTLLLAMGKDTGALLQFLGAVVIPSVIALYAGDQAKKARNSSDQAVRNTNGRMGQLIELLDKTGVGVPEGYEDIEKPSDSKEGKHRG